MLLFFIMQMCNCVMGATPMAMRDYSEIVILGAEISP